MFIRKYRIAGWMGHLVTGIFHIGYITKATWCFTYIFYGQIWFFVPVLPFLVFDCINLFMTSYGLIQRCVDRRCLLPL